MGWMSGVKGSLTRPGSRSEIGTCSIVTCGPGGLSGSQGSEGKSPFGFLFIPSAYVLGA